MGLFGFLKKKGPSHAEKVEQAYRGYIPEMAGKMFPGGVKQVDAIITSLAKLYPESSTLATKNRWGKPPFPNQIHRYPL